MWNIWPKRPGPPDAGGGVWAVAVNSPPVSVVGIGASAGGIEAFRRFFEKMPLDSGLGFVVVLHLAPDRISMLPAILARWTAMPVTEAHDGDAVTANHVLVVPPGTVASLHDGRLSLRQIPMDAPRETAPIDALFDSMAQDLNEDAIGVILSGTGHDGALGLKAIKARGGLTLAQGGKGTVAEYSGMPDSAAAAGAVDLFVGVEQMPALIVAAHKVRLAALHEAADPTVDFDTIRLAICDILRSRLGHDFSQYKRQTFMRRVQRRMQVLRTAHYDDYLAHLRDRPGTGRAAVPRPADQRHQLSSATPRPSRFWKRPSYRVCSRARMRPANCGSGCPGCATGEEAYSLAMLVREHMDTLPVLPKVQIFASDIDEVGDRHRSRRPLSRRRCWKACPPNGVPGSLSKAPAAT